MRTRWTETEKQLLIEQYDSTYSTVLKLAKQLNRTPSAIATKAYSMGLCRPERRTTYRRHWQQAEIDLLKEYAGLVTPEQLYRKHRHLCLKNGWAVRSPNAINMKLADLSLSRRIDGAGDYLSVIAIATALRCSAHVVRLWIKDKTYSSILKPETQSTHLIIRRRNLAKFFRQYPGELDRCRPHMAWLVDLICNPTQLLE